VLSDHEMRYVALAVALAACATQPVTHRVAPPKERPLPEKIEDLVGKRAPSFTLASARDDTTTITVPSAEVTVVTFFGTWSMGWQEALPMLDVLQKKHPGLRVVAVSIDEEKPRDVAQKYAPLPIAWAGGMATRTGAEWLSGPYGAENKVFVLDRRGTIRFAHRGGKEFSILATPSGPQTVEDEVTSLLAEP
jgi:peroxiredoxin